MEHIFQDIPRRTICSFSHFSGQFKYSSYFGFNIMKFDFQARVLLQIIVCEIKSYVGVKVFVCFYI